MGALGVGHAVGGDDHPVFAERGPDPLLLHHVHDHHAPGLPVAREALRRQPLAGLLPLQALVADAVGRLPVAVEERGLDRRRTRRVGVGLRGDVHTVGARAADQREHRLDLPEGDGVHVHHVQRRARRRRVRHHFLHADEPAAGDVREDRHARPRRELEDPEDLWLVRPRVVGVRHADADPAGGELTFELAVQPALLRRRELRVEGVAHQLLQRQERLLGGHGRGELRAQRRTRRLVHRERERPQRSVRDARAVVHPRGAAAGGEEGLDLRVAPLEFQRRGDAIHRLVLVRAIALAVHVQVHEARGHHVALHVEGPEDAGVRRKHWRAADGDDAPVVHGHLDHRVEGVRGVDDPAAGEEQVHLVGQRCAEDRRRNEERQTGQGGQAARRGSQEHR